MCIYIVSIEMSLMVKMEELRIDKWLWCARLFKIGEQIQVQLGQLHKVVEVKSIPKSRVSPKQVEEVYIDKTPKEEYERIEFIHAYKVEYRDRGSGRPTKKDRREIDRIKEF